MAGSRARKVLLTGMSGTGKSSVVVELEMRGFRAVDLDSPDWSETAPDGDWIWREDRVRKLLDTAGDGWLFLSGCAENQGKFRDRLDLIILLSAPTEIILERLATRTNNRYGKRPEEVADVLTYIETIEPLLRHASEHEIDTSAPLDEVVARVLSLAGA